MRQRTTTLLAALTGAVLLTGLTGCLAEDAARPVSSEPSGVADESRSSSVDPAALEGARDFFLAYEPFGATLYLDREQAVCMAGRAVADPGIATLQRVGALREDLSVSRRPAKVRFGQKAARSLSRSYLRCAPIEDRTVTYVVKDLARLAKQPFSKGLGEGPKACVADTLRTVEAAHRVNVHALEGHDRLARTTARRLGRETSACLLTPARMTTEMQAVFTYVAKPVARAQARCAGTLVAEEIMAVHDDRMARFDKLASRPVVEANRRAAHRGITTALDRCLDLETMLEDVVLSSAGGPVPDSIAGCVREEIDDDAVRSATIDVYDGRTDEAKNRVRAEVEACV